jgi:hypothetical protein
MYIGTYVHATFDYLSRNKRHKSEMDTFIGELYTHALGLEIFTKNYKIASHRSFKACSI